ncbi:ABC transporter ATP-binding protein [Haladaptatus pallidirubidus]|uniref:ABC transporter ATP-binding protein n=1 Tax=Haladaptatus pallidirubidus TaxID=1008152 RepID=UPI0035EF4E1F
MSMQTTKSEKRTGSEPLLTVRGLKKYFDQSNGVLDRLVGDTGHVRAVDGVDLTVHEGETLAIVGESGCGKSTLGRTVLNLHDATAGSVTYHGEDITELSAGEMRPHRRNLQMIFQDPLASLNPRQTVGEILTAPMEVHGIGADGEERLERAKELLERVGLKPAHIERYPNQFSGGQQQRVGIARALSLEPELIIADEPVSALDVSVQAQILNLLDELQDEFGLSLVFIAHNLSVVRHVADRVAVMYLGQIVETAPVAELYDNPQHPYTKSLLSAVPRIDPGDRDERIILEGTVPSPLNPPRDVDSTRAVRW